MTKPHNLIGFLALWALGSCTSQERPSRPQPQAQLNISLKHELDSLLVADQYYRELMMRAGTREGKRAVATELQQPVEQVGAYLSGRMLETDSSNIQRVSQLIAQYGYPGKSLVGEPTNEAAFYVIQHSNRIGRYLPLIREVAEKGELAFSQYAMMLDRQLMNENREQMYGTQGAGFELTNPATGQKSYQQLIWPIKDAATVNERRQQAGFEQTVEDNALRLGIPYRVYTLEEVQKMKQP
ncbi:DUF6624 domain-containing protein [Hymenobacter psychrophilus]|uniref:Uncharacterized protein n=1 Tax=Hymenobacter psychrophilus TaxID=651662 RepID=A0A1H3ND83_9BACT|nr:DUF6624 domain-containing protein [Hymenobacter psychrophilus]SDY86149.1 hypothetical protein SAMN04488069_11624 [Hymenobacter psychrophilus]